MQITKLLLIQRNLIALLILVKRKMLFKFYFSQKVRLAWKKKNKKKQNYFLKWPHLHTRLAVRTKVEVRKCEWEKKNSTENFLLNVVDEILVITVQILKCEWRKFLPVHELIYAFWYFPLFSDNLFSFTRSISDHR